MKHIYRLSIGFICFCFVALSFLPSLYDALDLPVRFAFGLICHAIPDRCIWINEIPIALCVRCMSIYLSVGATFLFNLSLPNPKLVLAIAVILIVMDAVLERLAFYDNVFPVRMLTGGFLGFAIANILLPQTKSIHKSTESSH